MKANVSRFAAIVVAMVHANPQRRRQRQRGGRQLDTGYGTPADYGAPTEEVIDVRSDDLPAYVEEPLDSYDLNAEASGLEEKAAGDAGLDMLMKAIPGIPGEDYPIYAEAPETAFSCEGQVNGGEF